MASGAKTIINFTKKIRSLTEPAKFLGNTQFYKCWLKNQPGPKKQQ